MHSAPALDGSAWHRILGSALTLKPNRRSGSGHRSRQGRLSEFDHRARRFDGEYDGYLTAASHSAIALGAFRWFAARNGHRGATSDAEGALRESEAKFRAAIDGIAGLVAIMAPTGELESVNRPIIEYFGRSVEELKNWGTGDAVHPEDLPRVLKSFKHHSRPVFPSIKNNACDALTANIGGLKIAVPQFATSPGVSPAGTVF